MTQSYFSQMQKQAAEEAYFEKFASTYPNLTNLFVLMHDAELQKQAGIKDIGKAIVNAGQYKMHKLKNSVADAVDTWHGRIPDKTMQRVGPYPANRNIFQQISDRLQNQGPRDKMFQLVSRGEMPPPPVSVMDAVKDTINNGVYKTRTAIADAVDTWHGRIPNKTMQRVGPYPKDRNIFQQISDRVQNLGPRDEMFQLVSRGGPPIPSAVRRRMGK